MLRYAPASYLRGVVSHAGTFSSTLPSQSSSMLLPGDVASSMLVAGFLATQLASAVPELHVRMPLDAHAPTPQLVTLTAKSSSTLPSQSSSSPLHTLSVALLRA